MTIAAEFYTGTRGGKRAAQIDVVSIENGSRTLIETRDVADKREARRICSTFGWTPWNF